MPGADVHGLRSKVVTTNLNGTAYPDGPINPTENVPPCLGPGCGTSGKD